MRVDPSSAQSSIWTLYQRDHFGKDQSFSVSRAKSEPTRNGRLVTCACCVVGHWEKCHLPLYLWPERASVLMGSASLIYIFWRLVQAPCKPSCSCLWACSRRPVTPTLQDLPGGDLGVIIPDETWLLLGGGSCCFAYHCGYGRQRIRHCIWWPCLQGKEPRMPHVFLGWGAVHH